MPKSQMEIEGTSTELSEMCDALLEARTEVEKAKEGLHSAEADLISAMARNGKKSIKHDGRSIRLVHTSEKNKIQIKSE